MTDNTPLDLDRVVPDEFTISNFDDEIRVDGLCHRLLMALRDQLAARNDLDPQDVGRLCHGADLFLRDFIIAECGDNLFQLPVERIRQFAGHWYIVRTLEPDAGELAGILAGVAACYELLATHRLVDRDLAEAVNTACTELPWYRQRIEDYWAITGDGFNFWRKACPLPERRS